MNDKKSQMEVVATFNDAEKAEKVKGRLEKGGFHAATFDEAKLQKYWFLSHPLAHHRVCVKREEAEPGRRFLKTVDPQEHLLDSEISCPECGSPRVEYPQFTRKFITTTAVMELGYLLGLTHRMFYCTSCGHTWPPVEKLRHHNDALNWPDQKNPHLVKKER